MFSLFTLCLIFASGILNCNGLTLCINPNGNRGFCIPKQSCTVLNTLAIQDNLSVEKQRFLEESQCVNEIGDRTNFCCNKDTGFIRKPEVFETRYSYNNKTTTIPPLGTSNICSQCGISSLRNKIYGGTNATIDDYPWLALLEYDEDDDSQKYRCGGSLINHRYILTAAHCVKRQSANNFIRVRLGETDITTHIDCDSGSNCNEPPVDVGYEKVIIHEGYNPQTKINDIALIRLERDVQFTSFIKPICLPDCNKLQTLSPEQKLVVAGWGFTEYRNEFSTRKLHVQVPFVDRKTCNSRLHKNYLIDESQICAGGVKNEDTCRGDSGGPLMRSDSNKWYAEGIVSFGILIGADSCGTEYPSVYTKVSSYSDWIRKNIIP